MEIINTPLSHVCMMAHEDSSAECIYSARTRRVVRFIARSKVVPVIYIAYSVSLNIYVQDV